MPPSHFDLDYRRLSRWCLLGTIVMLLWLMAPVVKCSWTAFAETPIGEVQSADAPARADQERVEEGLGFFSRWGRAIDGCYKQTPLFGQEGWKGHLLVIFGVLYVLMRTLHYFDQRRRRTFDD